MLIALPYYTNFIMLEMDGTIWAHRYNPSDNSGDGTLIARIDQCFPKTLQVPLQIKDHKIFINEQLEFVDRDGKDYGRIALKEYLKGEKKK